MVNVNDEYLVFDKFRLRTKTKSESTWKILKLDCKTPGFFSLKRVGTPIGLYLGSYAFRLYTLYAMFIKDREFCRYSVGLSVGNEPELWKNG